MNELIYDKFDRYYRSKMTSEEVKSFEIELTQNDETRHEYQKYLLAIDAIEESIADDLRDKFESWDASQEHTRSSGSIVLMITRWAAAAVILIGLFSGGLAAYQINEVNHLVENDLFHAYSYTLRSQENEARDKEVKSQLELADKYFEQSNFNQALEIYQAIQQNMDAPEDLVDKAEFHECLALYHLNGRHPAFEESLNQIAEDQDHVYHEKAREFREKLNKTLVRFFKG